MKKLMLLLALVFFLSGCTQPQQGISLTAAEQARIKCIELCNAELAKGIDLSNGPCLSNKIVEGWVCDVAHSPRQAIDNNPANQCPAFGKTAGHFVEVNPECTFIRAV